MRGDLTTLPRSSGLRETCPLDALCVVAKMRRRLWRVRLSSQEVEEAEEEEDEDAENKEEEEAEEED